MKMGVRRAKSRANCRLVHTVVEDGGCYKFFLIHSLIGLLLWTEFFDGSASHVLWQTSNILDKMDYLSDCKKPNAQKLRVVYTQHFDLIFSRFISVTEVQFNFLSLLFPFQ
jgi:hypothetical protein